MQETSEVEEQVPILGRCNGSASPKSTWCRCTVWRVLAVFILGGFFVAVFLLHDVFQSAFTNLNVDKEDPFQGLSWFMLGFAFWVIMCIPYSAYVLGGAFLFGMWRGFLILYANIFMGSFLVFTSARFCRKRGLTNSLVGQSSHANYILGLKKAFKDHGLKLSFLIMFSPVPQPLIVVLLALLTDVDIIRFLMGSTIALYIVYAPQIVIAAQASNLSDAINPHNPVQLALGIASVAVVCLLLSFMTYYMRSVLESFREESDEDGTGQLPGERYHQVEQNVDSSVTELPQQHP